jgi:transposase
MVWGGIGLAVRIELVIVDRGTLNADRYITIILQDHVVPFAPHIGDNFILMQDNARPHIARCVTNFLTETEITKMNWPARSPDMSPIEHVWDMLDKRVKARIPAPQTTQALQTMLLEEWDNLPQELIDNSIRSMPSRMIALIRARGGNTRY